MRLGLCSELSRLWIRLVIKTVLPERLSPVTASQTVAPPANSPRLLTSRSDACAKMGGSQLKLTMGGMPIPIDRFALSLGRQLREVGSNPNFCKWLRHGRNRARQS